jgi:hypothetical protein
MANCAPCLKLGLQLVAHYGADKASAKEPECYYHHFNLPLPASIQQKISMPKSVESAFPEMSAITDIGSVAPTPVKEKKRSETTPAGRAGLQPDVCEQCWAEGHTCKAYCTVDGKRLCIDCTDGEPCVYVRKKQTDTRTPVHERYHVTIRGVKKRKPALALNLESKGNVASLNHVVAEPLQDEVAPQKEEENGMNKENTQVGSSRKRCACGCGQQTTTNRSPFVRGHNPDAKNFSGKSKSTPPRKIVATPVAQPSGIATICVTEANLDSFWSRLSLEEKANLFQRQLEGA